MTHLYAAPKMRIRSTVCMPTVAIYADSGVCAYTSVSAGAEASVKSLLPTLREVRVQLVKRDFSIG